MLSASHLTRRFGDRTAVEDVSLDLAAGEILALLGPNGAGKTTTLRMLAGLIAPTSGAVTVDGAPLVRATAARLRGRIGFLTEAPGLWDRLSVEANLLVHARLQGVTDPRGAVTRVLALLDIVDRRLERPAQLSKGLRQRVALARTLLHEPTIVLLDEPTSGLDPESARDVRGLILRMKRDGRAVLVSTHNLDEVERIADRVAVLDTRLVAIDTPQALRTRLFGSRVRIVVAGDAASYVDVLRRAGAGDVRADGRAITVDFTNGTGAASASTPAGTPAGTPRLVTVLVQAGALIESVVPEQPTIEDVYLRLLERTGLDSVSQDAGQDRVRPDR